MAIAVNEKVFTLCTKNSMYQMKADEHGVLLHTYYGKRGITDFPEILMMQKRTENIHWIRCLRNIPVRETATTGKALLL